MKICVAGLWHLGSVTAGCLASLGHRVIGFDFDAAVIADLRNGKLPVSEPGLDKLIKAALSSGNLSFTSAPAEIGDADVLWCAHDTPVDDSDNADTDWTLEQIDRLVPHVRKGAVVLISAQLPVGSVRRIEQAHADTLGNRQWRFACSPENLRLGRAIDDFLQADRIVVGIRSDADKADLNSLLSSITQRIEWMSVESAEATKHAINAFLATSVTFANEIASLCEAVGADAKEVERGLKTERRIGPRAYLSPGAAFAGGTLARDIEFLTATARAHSVSTPLLSSVIVSNNEHKRWAQNKLAAFFGDLREVPIAVWGLTYKPGTDTLRRSLMVEFCDWLIERGATVRVHDPAAKTLPQRWNGKVTRYDDPGAAVDAARALVIGTEWPMYKEVARSRLAECSNNLVVLDANRFLVDIAPHIATLRYFAVGTADSRNPNV